MQSTFRERLGTATAFAHSALAEFDRLYIVFVIVFLVYELKGINRSDKR